MGHDSRLNPFAKENHQILDGIVDARGRQLAVGDEIILNTLHPLYLRVIRIAPVLDPKAPPGMMQIEFGAATHFFSPKGVPQREFIRVRTAEEAGPSNLVRLDDEGKGEA